MYSFTPEERASGTHWIGVWVGPRTGLDDAERRKSCPYRDSNSDRSAVQPVASRCTGCPRTLITDLIEIR
jgi:hypothetical protein